MQSFHIAKQTQTALYAECDRLTAILRAFPHGPMGLTPDDVKQSPEFQSIKKAYDNAFAALRAFNQAYVKTYKRELAKERRGKR